MTMHIKYIIKFYEDKIIEEKKDESEYIIPKRDSIKSIEPINEYMIKYMGRELYMTKMRLDNIQGNDDFMKKHNISSACRTQMVGHMVDVFASYSSDPLSFFVAVEIIDNYLQKTERNLNQKEFLLLALTSIFISSKMEDIIPIPIDFLQKKIGYELFSKEQINTMEIEILSLLKCDIIFCTTYDMLKIILSEFYLKNKDVIYILKMNKICYHIEIFSIFLGKLICLSETFCKYNKSILAISIIIAACNIIFRKYHKSETAENFIRQWLWDIFKESNYPLNTIEKIHNEIIFFFENIKNIWYPDIKNNGERFNIIAIVGNKKDKYEEEEVTEQEAMKFAEEIDGKFFLVSAYTGEGIDTMFQTLANNFFDEVFMSKVNESREERIDSIVLNDKTLKKRRNNINCC